MTRTAEQSTMRKVYLRLLPFSILCMFVCYLDRVNVGFAALTMNKDLGLSAYLFGLGAGAFYGGYCLFRGSQKLDLGKSGRPILACPHHDHLGPHFRCDGVCHRPH